MGQAFGFLIWWYKFGCSDRLPFLNRALQFPGFQGLLRPEAAKLPFAGRFSPHPGFLRPMTSFRSQECCDFFNLESLLSGTLAS